MRSVEAHQMIVADLFPRPSSDLITVDRALGRVLASRVSAPTRLPGFDNSAMDGYAIRVADITAAPATLPVTQDIPAGRTDRLALDPGTAHRIMTGAPLPAGADAVVPVEQTDGGTDQVTIHQLPTPGANIRRAGSDITVGDTALPTGQLIGPAQLGLIAALGLPTVTVTRQLHVLVVSTGSELVEPGRALEYGQIYESNGPMLAAALTAAGAIAHRIHFVPDDTDEFLDRISEFVDNAADHVDLILTSGGVSAGAYEVVKDALADQDVEFVKVAMQPGMPQGAGRFRSRGGRVVPIITVPGNPVSAQVSFEVFVRPPLRRAMGLSAERTRVAARITESMRSVPGKRQFRRGILTMDGAPAVVRPIGPPSSHHLRFLASANALLDVPADVESVDSGTLVSALLID